MNKNRLENLEMKLLQKEKELYSIQKIGQALSSTLHLDDLLNLIMKEITVLINADRSTLYLIDRENHEIWSKIALKAEIREIRQKIGVGISGVAAASGQTINIPDAYKDQRFDPTTDKKTGYRTRSILCLPVWEPTTSDTSREILGVIQVLNKKDGIFTPEDEAIMEAIASEVAVSISNARLYEQLEQKYREIDLLYEFEQKLSSEYILDEVLKDILAGTVIHLNNDETGLLYPEQKGMVLLTINKDKISSRKLMQSIGQELSSAALINISGKKLLNHLNKTLHDNFNDAIPIPVHTDDEDILFACLLLKNNSPQERPPGSDHSRTTEMIVQKISRAIELYSLRQKLFSQERLTAIGQMMSTIVHDLRSPVNSINGFLDLLLEEDTSRVEREEYSNIMRMEIQSIINMTTEILDFAKGKTSILPRKTSAVDILKRFQPQLEQLFKNTKIKLHIENNSRKLLYADVDKLVRVFHNIAKNAKEALGSGGLFSFNVHDGESAVVFNLSDNGPGIPEEIKSRIFESFVTSGKESGTGLGLAIVKKIIDEHHGTIKLKSGKGKGTDFQIKLPEMKMDE